MELAFWESSSLVPLCVVQPTSTKVRQLSARYLIAVWWAAPVEMRSAFSRLRRMGQLGQGDIAAAQNVLRVLRQNWREISPSAELRDDAEAFIDRFPLKSADALQLAAAHAWSMRRPRGRVFISGDTQLLDAARQLGFQTVEA